MKRTCSIWAPIELQGLPEITILQGLCCLAILRADSQTVMPVRWQQIGSAAQSRAMQTAFGRAGRRQLVCSMLVHAAQVLVRLLDGLSALHQAAGMHAALRWALGCLRDE